MEEERKRIEEEEIGPAPEYASGIGNPNTPLVFPDFDPMPELRNIVKHSLGEEDDVPKLEEEKQERSRFKCRIQMQEKRRKGQMQEGSKEKSKSKYTTYIIQHI